MSPRARKIQSRVMHYLLWIVSVLLAFVIVGLLGMVAYAFLQNKTNALPIPVTGSDQQPRSVQKAFDTLLDNASSTGADTANNASSSEVKKVEGSTQARVNQNLQVRTIAFGANEYSVEIADTDTTREQGLSGRTSLEYGRGMLFVFEKPQKVYFWMKDMLFPIDMIWIDESGKVVHLEKSVSPSTYPDSFNADKPVKYVLELAAGESDRIGLQIGNIMNFSKNSL